MKKTEQLLKALFAAYLVFLVWAILFKFGFSLDAIRGTRVLNLIPYYNDGTAPLEFIWTEIIGNVIIFVPFGLYLYLLGQRDLIKDTLLIACFSLLLETMQWCFACGVSDITDVINNTLGGMIGLGLGMLVLGLFHRRDRVLKVLTGLSCAGTVTMYLGIVLTGNFRLFMAF